MKKITLLLFSFICVYTFSSPLSFGKSSMTGVYLRTSNGIGNIIIDENNSPIIM